MESRNRDEAIRHAFTLGHLRVATWTQVKKETGLPDGKVTRGLKSLVKYGEVHHKGRWYALTTHQPELEKKAAASRRRGERSIPEEHILNMASGLRALAYQNKYRVREELISKPEYVEHALQHYPEIADMLSKINSVSRGIDEIMGELATEVVQGLKGLEEWNEFKKKGISIAVPKDERFFLECFLTPRDLSEVSLRIDREIMVKASGSGWAVCCEGRILYTARDAEDAGRVAGKLKESISRTIADNEALLQELKGLSKRRLDLVEAFQKKVDLTIKKLVDIGKLDGECDICKDTT